MATVIPKTPTFEELALRALHFEEPRVKKIPNLLGRYNDALVCWQSLAADLGKILAAQRCPISIPTVAPAGASIARLSYPEAVEELRGGLTSAVSKLAAFARATKVGRIEWISEEACRFSFNELRTIRGLLAQTIVRTSHTHELVQARVHRLPANEIPKPPAAKLLLSMMGAPLREATRVVTGMLVVKGEVATEKLREPTALGRGVEKIGMGVRTLAAKGKAAASGVGSALRGVQVALSDPAIVVGDLVLYGWED